MKKHSHFFARNSIILFVAMFQTLASILLGACLAHAELYEFSDEYINKINEEAKTWTAGRNFPADISREYVRNFLTGHGLHNISELSERPSAMGRKLSDPEWPELEAPSEFDARKQWSQCPSIGFVPDTGACNAPQIYAAVAAFTDRRCIKSNGNHQEALSTEYVASCCIRCRYDTTKSCTAGSVYRVWQFLHYRGSVTGGPYGASDGCQPASVKPCSHYGTAPTLPSCELQEHPQLQCHTRCTNENYPRGFFKDKHRTTIAYWVDSAEEAIKKEITAHGPVTATFTLYDDFFHYRSGVYQHTSTAKYQQTLLSGKLIGWGVENSTPYWLVITPWSMNWGDKGTVKILRGKFECGIEYLIAAGKAKN